METQTMAEVKIVTVLTGDLVNSRGLEVSKWHELLKETLSAYSDHYDVFRGDSFQAVIAVQDTFEAVFYILAKLRTLEGLSVRMGIGVGTANYTAEDVKSSNGEVFVHSGAAFDALKKNLLRIKSPWSELDAMVDIVLDLCVELSKNWTSNMANTVSAAIRYPELNQQELAKRLAKKHQSQISTELRKAGYYKIKNAIDYCTKQLLITCSSYF